jgi:hypothetical protein
MINTCGFIIYEAGYKKGRKNDYDIHKENHPKSQNKLQCIRFRIP